MHLVFVDQRTAPRIPGLAEVRDQVRLDVLAERRVLADTVFYQGLKQKYDITIERPESELENELENTATKSE